MEHGFSISPESLYSQRFFSVLVGVRGRTHTHLDFTNSLYLKGLSDLHFENGAQMCGTFVEQK